MFSLPLAALAACHAYSCGVSGARRWPPSCSQSVLGLTAASFHELIARLRFEDSLLCDIGSTSVSRPRSLHLCATHCLTRFGSVVVNQEGAALWLPAIRLSLGGQHRSGWLFVRQAL